MITLCPECYEEEIISPLISDTKSKWSGCPDCGLSWAEIQSLPNGGNE